MFDTRDEERRVKSYVRERFNKCGSKEFNRMWNEYKSIGNFKINGNIFKIKSDYNNDLHSIMRLVAQYYLEKTFKAMKIDIEDPNVKENLDDNNIGTVGRIIKTWTGSSIDDDREFLSGRFHKDVRLATFPNVSKEVHPIIKEIDLTAVCSHHFAPFSTKFSSSSKVIIAYIPLRYVLGISKLQRLVRYIAQRGWLQEDLTYEIYNQIAQAASSDSVYVKLKNIKHSCEFLRGAMSDSDGFTTEYFGGLFKSKPELLEFVRSY